MHKSTKVNAGITFNQFCIGVIIYGSIGLLCLLNIKGYLWVAELKKKGLKNNNDIDLKKGYIEYLKRVKSIFSKKARLYEKRFR